MRPTRADYEKISLGPGTFLVLWDVLTRTVRNPEARKEITPGYYQLLFEVDEAERQALHSLAGAIQRGILDVMSNDLPELIAKEKARIMSRPK